MIIYCFYRIMTLVQSAILRSHVVCLSVRLSVTLVDCDHIGWNSSEIISRLVSLGCLLSADRNIRGLLQGEHPEIWAQSDLPPKWWFHMPQYKRMAISPRRVIRYTSCLVLGWGFQGWRIEWRYFRFEQTKMAATAMLEKFQVAISQH